MWTYVYYLNVSKWCIFFISKAEFNFWLTSACLPVKNSLNELTIDLCLFPNIPRWNHPGSRLCVGLSLYSPILDPTLYVHKSLACQGKDTLSQLVWAHWWWDGRGLFLILLFLARTVTGTCLLVHIWFPSNTLALPLKLQALGRIVATWILYIFIDSKQQQKLFSVGLQSQLGPFTGQSDLH